ncbi:MAG: hypothetical protein STSR0008_07190 [Ignavibacterium sp.]
MTLEEKIKQLHKLDAMTTETNERLNISGFIMSDGPHGVRDGLATSFPVGIGMAATWDIELAQRVGIALGEEFRGKGKNQMLGPAIDLTRDPRNGRTPESGGEDPFLNAMINSALIKGVQTTPTIATAKHFNCKHKQTGRNSNNYTMTQHWLMDHYGLNFRTAVQDAGVLSIMSAYNRINGEQSAENYNLLTTILRNNWGFPYYVVSDWGAVHNSEKAIESGTDICMGSDHYQNDLYNLVMSGAVSENTINESVRKVLRTKIISGMMDYYPQGNPEDVNSEAHQQLCLEAGKKGIVLLKNQNNILPLDKDTINSILIVGPNANVMRTDGTGSSWVTPFYTVSPKQGIENYIDPTKIFYFQGCDISTSLSSDFSQALQKAQEVDLVIFFGGLDPSQEGEGLDRVNGSILLPGKQNDAIMYLSVANKNIIVVLISGGICTASPFINDIKGLIYGFYPGQEGGNAIAQVLFGDYNPSGKLPVTMPISDSQLSTEITDFDFTNDFGCGYRWFDWKNLIPQFAFGFGLSYTTFLFNNLIITPTVAPIGEIIEVNVDVKNTGSKKGEEVVQLYLSNNQISEDIPYKELKGFKKVELEPNETKTVTFQITPNELYRYNESTNQYEVKPGIYNIRVGNSSDSLPLIDTFELTPSEPKPDLQIASLKLVPPFPLKDDKVQFLATIINRGTGKSPEGISHEIIFSVDDKKISKSIEFDKSILPGGMALVNGTIGIDGDYFWMANELGAHTLEAVVNQEKTISETISDNNSKSISFKVYDTPPINLALNSSVVVSSFENEGLKGENAVDGNYSTRWSSKFSDPQSIIIDLGTVQHFNQIKLFWENAYGKEYKIDISNDNINWNTIVYNTNGVGGVESFNIDTTARYIRIYGIKRGTEWGYSLFEIEVYFSEITAIKEESDLMEIRDYILFNNYPNPFNPSTKIKFAIPFDVKTQNFASQNYNVSLKIYNITGQEITTLVNEVKLPGVYEVEFNGKGLSSGIYFYKMTVGNFTSIKKMILLK